MYHPSRGGVRGGQDQFDWEDVKLDKHRESYLGHSVKAPVGRWQKGKDLHWYTKSGKGNSGMSKQEEKDAVKRMEAEALAIALGRGPSKKVASGVSKQELAEVCRKGQVERDSMDIERVQGMGFGSTRASLVAGLSAPMKETLSATGSQQERHADPATPSNTKTGEVLRSEREEDHASDKIKRKKEKKEKKSKKEKKHKKRRHGEIEKKKKKNHSEEADNEYKKSKHSRKRTHDHDKVNQNNSKRERHDSSSSGSDSCDKRDRYSRRRHDSSDGDISRTTTARHRDRVEERPGQRRQRHDTE